MGEERRGKGRSGNGQRLATASRHAGASKADSPSDTVTNGEDTAGLLNVSTGGRARDSGFEDRGNLRSRCTSTPRMDQFLGQRGLARSMILTRLGGGVGSDRGRALDESR